MEKFVTESEVLKLIDQVLSKSKKTSKGAATLLASSGGEVGEVAGSAATPTPTDEAVRVNKKMSYDDFFKDADENDLLTRVFRAHIPTPAELYPNGLVGVSDEDLAVYLTYVVRSLVMCGFVHSYSAWMYMMVMNARKDTVFGHRNLELHQLKNLVTLLAVPLVDGSGRKSMAERVTSTLAQRTTYDLVCELAVRVSNGEVLTYTGPPITHDLPTEKKIVRKASSAGNMGGGGEGGGAPSAKKAKKAVVSNKKKTSSTDVDEEEAEAGSDNFDDADDDEVFPMSPSRKSTRVRTPPKSFFPGEFVVAEEGDVAEDEEDVATQPQLATQQQPQLEFLTSAEEAVEGDVENNDDESVPFAEASVATTEDVQNHPMHPQSVAAAPVAAAAAAAPAPAPVADGDVEAADPIEFTPGEEAAVSMTTDLSFEKITIPMVPRANSPLPPLVTTTTSLVKKLVIKRPGAPAAVSAAPAMSSALPAMAPPSAVSSLDSGVHMNPEGTGYHSEGTFSFIWEPVDVNRHMTVLTRAGSWAPFFNWRSAYEKDPRPENRYTEYHRRDGTTASLEGYVRRFFEVWPMPGLDLMDVDVLTPVELDVMVKQHMRTLLKKKTLGELRDAL